ncbi:uncharacterized conserved protein YbbC, DUF1343 family [Bacteroidales bacterium 6E]|nr:uncharacterized conserved protein YbbC, DUF1343 family [Bacteroidales bacterium 6E]
MKPIRLFFLFTVLITLSFGCQARNQGSETAQSVIVTGADQPEMYLPMLQGKKVGLVVNHTAIAGNKLLPDYLVEQGVDVQKIFAPEHGFRGEAAAGEVIKDGKDPKTGIRVFSLYGDVKKPTQEHLAGLDILVFDIQDVGCRFYTYLSTLYYCIESCAEYNVPLLVLDRPNPNGDYIAGPVRKHDFISFVGMVPVPIVHGCTLGEMALMINGEGWPGLKARIDVVKVKNYSHADRYELPVSPSPNLPNYTSVRLYPSLCFFEATSVSIGRGTDFPFQVIGGTLEHLGDFTFTPVNMPGVAVNPINMNKKCFGVDLRDIDPVPPFTLKYFLDFYKKYPTEKDFLTSERWLNLLAGTDSLIKDIRAGKEEAEIVASWEQEINAYKSVRRKYLLYPDF